MHKLPTKKKIARKRDSILDWYRENRRPLPWRSSRNPYKIWISEVMLQQTTVQAVIPYYERFLKRFPSIDDLATADISEVYEAWAGLGYYSRARNLHKAAQEISKIGFAQSWEDLIKLPGFGDYTSRAVSSLAFGESVGVVDGNVIRVLSRAFNLSLEWWKTKEKRFLQSLSDSINSEGPSEEINQALMELGATICTPQSPACLICPWSSTCESRKQDTHLNLPLKKKKAPPEIWHWKLEVPRFNKKSFGFQENNYAPFLKNHLLPPGEVRRLKKAPRQFDLRHKVTKYDLFIDVEFKNCRKQAKSYRWIDKKAVSKEIPLSVVKKILSLADSPT